MDKDKLTLLLDGDVFAYQAALQAQTQIVWDEDQATLTGDMGEAKVRLDDRIQWIKEKLKGTHLIVALSDIGSGYWRRSVLPSYKENRKAVMKPILLRPLREYLMENYYCKVKPMLEGDDVLGIMATHPSLVPGRKWIVSVDKDMKTIPGTFARITQKDGVDVMNITPAEADRYHMLQTLTGDSTDGYKGCPKVGPVSAAKLLEPLRGDAAGMWTAVVLSFRKAGLTEEDALVQARVARILRYTDYDFTTKQPILWTAPTITKGTHAEIPTNESPDTGKEEKQGDQQRLPKAKDAGVR